MDWDDYFRQQAAMYRQLAEKTEDVLIKQELLDLAAVCEEVAITSRIVGQAGSDDRGLSIRLRLPIHHPFNSAT
jgi:hypothetical protein